MPRKPDPLTELKRHTRTLKNLWVALAKKYLEILSSDEPVPASMFDQINDFLRMNNITLDRFVDLDELTRLKADGKGSTDGIVKRETPPGASDQNADWEKELEEFLGEPSKSTQSNDPYNTPLNE